MSTQTYDADTLSSAMTVSAQIILDLIASKRFAHMQHTQGGQVEFVEYVADVTQHVIDEMIARHGSLQEYWLQMATHCDGVPLYDMSEAIARAIEADLCDGALDAEIPASVACLSLSRGEPLPNRCEECGDWMIAGYGAPPSTEEPTRCAICCPNEESSDDV